MRICVDRDGNVEFGFEKVRSNMVKLFFVIFKFGSNYDFEILVMYCFKEVFYIFLEYLFVNLYWRIKSIKVMKDVVEVEVFLGFVKVLFFKV